MKDGELSRRVLAVVAFLLSGGAAAALVAFPRGMQDEGMPAADNSHCVTCHIEHEEEVLAAKHLAGQVACVGCHGPSTEHGQDETGMTKPDLVHGRAEVKDVCQVCHPPKPPSMRIHKRPGAVAEFKSEWLGRVRPNGRVITEAAVCTDCHGTHNVLQRKRAAARAAAAGEWISLFNGRDLTGWEVSGGARWTVEDGLLVGMQGDGHAPGDLLTTASHDDFELLVTYRAVWPCNTGVWFRYQSASQAYQADILEYADPECYAGSLYCTGKMFLALNEDKSLIDRDGWNTMRVRAVGDRVQTWINGHAIADVRDDTSATGRIGFQIHAGAEFEPMRIVIRDVQLSPR